MREQDARAAPRLRFSKEEMQPESLEHLSAKTKAARKKAAKPAARLCFVSEVVCMSRKSAVLEDVWRAGVPYDFFEALEIDNCISVDFDAVVTLDSLYSEACTAVIE